MMLSTELKYKIRQAVSPVAGKPVLIAFSGGVDSTVAAKILQVAACKIKLVTVTSEWISKQELDEAKQIAHQLDLPHEILGVDVEKEHIFWKNPPDRCFHCKKLIFSQLHALAMRENFEVVVDGTNASDTDGHRPGLKALEELSVYSPLRQSGLTKKEVRQIAEFYNLSVAKKPAMACLASRIPYGEVISTNSLTRVENAESYLRTLNLSSQLRIRDHGNLARIELAPDSIKEICTKDLTLIVQELKKMGYRYVTLDLEGYRPITPD